MNNFTTTTKNNSNTVIYLFLSIIIGLFVIGYYDIFQWMYGRYMGADSYYSHGFLVPFVSGYLIWLQREELAQVQKKGSWVGLLLIVAAVLIHIFGTVIYIFSVSGFSIWILIVGISLFLYGTAVTRIIFFPLAFLLFMFPLPGAIITMISFPLKVLVAQMGVKIASLLGVPLLLEGFVITIPQGDLLVGNPCSGLRSLIAFLAMGSLFAYFSELSKGRQIFLFLLTIPIAIASNLVRVPILIYWSYKRGLESAAPDTMVHTGSGFVVFILGLILLFIALRCLGGTHEK
ncbi:MAG: exosortase [Desulfuromusa sp.]|nr:exosortase [Desulfuromusa sp.]